MKKRYKIQQLFMSSLWDEAWPYDPDDNIPPDRYDTKQQARQAIKEFLQMFPDYSAAEFRIVEDKADPLEALS